MPGSGKGKTAPARSGTGESAAVHEANQRRLRVYHALSGGVLILDADGWVVDANATAEALLGVPLDILRSAGPATSFFEPCYPDGTPMPIEERPAVRAVRTGKPVRAEMIKMRHPDGTLLSLQVDAVPMYDPAGALDSVVVSYVDLTARVAAEDALRESEKRYRLLAENATDLISRHGPDGAVLYVSPSSRVLLGCAPEEVMNGTAGIRYHPDDVPEVMKAIEALRAGENRFTSVYRMLRADGRYIWFETLSRAIRDPETGALVEIQCSSRDISERKRAEEALEQTNRELIRSNAELEHFASVVSHDLRGPLNTILGYTDLLSLPHASEDEAAFLAHIVHGAEHMHLMIADLLAYASLGGRHAQPVPVPCMDLVGGVIERLAADIQESGAKVFYRDLPIVYGDAIQLGQLFQNLIGNALKFRRPQVTPRVRIQATRQDSMWEISVRDNGIGFNSAQSDRIFDIFQRLHSRTAYDGTGIGLSVCKKIVERHGGRIRADGRPGRGATFTFTLPAIES